MRVIHPRFGRGTIVRDTGRTILVLWDRHTVKRVTTGLSVHHSHVYRRSTRPA